MTEVARFFDSVAYTEADQAEVQTRFRPSGVLLEAGDALKVGTSGGMFVTVGSGEAIVEGFWYKNTTALPLAIGSNSSGSTRHDVVALRLNRTANELKAVIIIGTPGAGIPAVTQVVGGTWEMILAIVTVSSGTLSIIPSMIADGRTYSAFIGSRVNRFHNSSMRVNQRSVGNVNASGQMPVDRWICGLPVSGGFVFNVQPQSPWTGEFSSAMCANRINTNALTANDLLNFQQNFEGVDVQPMQGNSLCISWWSYSPKTGTFGFNLEQVGSNWRYMHSWTHGIASVWEFHYVVVPWNGGAGWVTSQAGSMVARWVVAAGANYQHTVTNQWINIASKYAPPDISNALSGSGDQLFVARPKMEIGTYPTPYETPDLAVERIQSYRHYQTNFPYGTVVPTNNAASFHPIGGNSIPHGMYVTMVKFTVPMRVGPTVTVYPYGNVGNTSRVSSDTGADFGASSGVPAAVYTTHFGINNLSGSTLTTNQHGVHFAWTASADV